LKEFGLLREANPPGLAGDLLRLHFDRAKARELTRQILAQIGEEE